MDIRREDVGDLLHLLSVAEARGFTRAAAKSGVSQSALSHAIRRLEERVGVRLLARTTRAVALTEAGERLVAAARPAFAEIADGLAALDHARARPAGMVRITTTEHAALSILWPAARKIAAQYPDIGFAIEAEAALTDIVAEGYDAGVRLGEHLDKDMVSVRIGPPLRMAAVAAPAYLASRGVPQTPHDLAGHECVNLRMRRGGGLYAWEFSRQGRELRVRVEGRLTFNRMTLVVEATLAGFGVGFVMEDQAAPHLASGALRRVLEDWCEPFEGYHLYLPSRRQQSPALAVLIETLRYRGP